VLEEKTVIKELFNRAKNKHSFIGDFLKHGHALV
jgi:hypothetical protein